MARKGKSTNPFVKADLDMVATKKRILDACERLTKKLRRKVTISEVVNAALAETADFDTAYFSHESKRLSEFKDAAG